MAQTVTNRGKHLLATGALVPGTTDLRLGLLGSQALTGTEHTAVSDMNFVDDMTGTANFDELSGVASYARQALGGESATEDDTNDWSLIDSNDVAFGALETGDSIFGAFLFVHTGDDATAELVAVYDLAETPTNGGAVTVTTPNGLLRVT